MARTFQKVEVFGGMTVLGNIRLGRHIHLKSGILSGSMFLGKTAREVVEHRPHGHLEGRHVPGVDGAEEMHRHVGCDSIEFECRFRNH